MKKIFERKLTAFTLSELLVVLVIVGILILMALPSLMPLISRTRGVEAKQMLQHVQTLEKMYYFEHSKYSSNLNEVGFEQQKLVTQGTGGTANYLIEIVQANQQKFVARATSVVDFDGDGVFNVWEVDQELGLREIVED